MKVVLLFSIGPTLLTYHIQADRTAQFQAKSVASYIQAKRSSQMMLYPNPAPIP